MERLSDPEQFARIKAEVLSEDTEWENLAGASGPQNIRVSGMRDEGLRGYNGSRLSEIADAEGEHWVDMAADIVKRGGAGMVIFMMSEENVKLQLQQPWIKFGTDAAGIDPENARGLTHPRAYGTFPRILGKYVRDEGVLLLEEAVRKASSAVATRLGIQGRGVLREGHVRRPGHIRPGDHRRSCHLRRAAPALRRHARRAGQRRAGGSRRHPHRCQAGPSSTRARPAPALIWVRG